jgi:cytochrome c-type biogenesis protein CcmH/NrfG
MLVDMNAYRRHTPPAAEAELARLDAALEHYRHRTQEIAREFAVAVGACIEAGATWGEVGERIGMTKQGARDHWTSFIKEMAAGQAGAGPADQARPGPRAAGEPAAAPVPETAPEPD